MVGKYLVGKYLKMDGMEGKDVLEGGWDGGWGSTSYKSKRDGRGSSPPLCLLFVSASPGPLSFIAQLLALLVFLWWLSTKGRVSP